MTELFNRKPTGDISPKQPAEANSAFLQRSDSDVARNIRRVMREWFGRFPDAEQIRGRLESGDDQLFLGTFFELYMHELISRSGGSVTIHPKVPESSRPPDFLVQEDEQPPWYCEAKVVTEISEPQRGRDALLDNVLGKLDQIESPDFWLNVHSRGSLKAAPSVSKIVSQIRGWLSELVWEEVARAHRAEYPELVFREEGWTMRLEAMPRSEVSRGREGQRTLGFQSLRGFEPVETRKAVAKAFKGKATKYGHLGRPFVLAISTTQPSGGQEEIRAALFGDNGCSGCFADSSRVSAVLAVSMLAPTTVASQEPALYRNPTPRHEYAGCLSRFERSSEGRRESTEEGIGEFLNLPEGWLWQEGDV